MKGQVLITEIWAWTIVDVDGTEGVPAFQGTGGAMIPMVGADKERIESLRPIAQGFANHHGRELQLKRFSQFEVLDTVIPER